MPWNILAITFTNKAANEMKERIETLVGSDISNDIWIGTFHSICLRILRKHIESLGYEKNFSIYDVSEQKQIIKQIIKRLKLLEGKRNGQLLKLVSLQVQKKAKLVR